MKMEELGVTKGMSMEKISETSENSKKAAATAPTPVTSKLVKYGQDDNVNLNGNSKPQSDFVLNISSPSFFSSAQSGNNGFTSNISLISFGNQDSQRSNVFPVVSPSDKSKSPNNGNSNNNDNSNNNSNNNSNINSNYGDPDPNGNSKQSLQFVNFSPKQRPKAKQSVATTVLSSELETMQ